MIQFNKIVNACGRILLSFVLVVALLPVTQVNAEDIYACDELYYSMNDVLFFNPCDSTCEAASQAGTTLQGVDNVEKIWNFYASKGLKPEAIAGIMGNFSQESHFDPAIKQDETLMALPISGDGVTGYGIAQWTSKGRQAGLFSRMDTAGLGKYLGEGWGASEKNKEIPAEDLDKLLEIELVYSWEGDSTKIQDLADQLNATTSVEGDNGSTTLFHNLYEVSSDNASQIQERVTDAKMILEKFGGSSTTTANGEACTSNSKLGGIKTMQDAEAWANRYVEDTKAKYPSTDGSPMNEGDNPKYLYNLGHNDTGDGYCWNAADCGQCVAMSGWFVLNQTTDGKFLYQNGGYIVDKYEAAGLPTGRDPRPFSVFSAKSSEAGHTGVVLGVLDNGDVITVETNQDSSGSVSVWQGNIQSRYAGKDLKFAYFDDRLAKDAAAALSSTAGGGPK